MEKGYKYIFWGIFAATFSISLGPIRILPAFIAWAIVGAGLNEMKEDTGEVFFDSAIKHNRFLTIVLFLLGLFSLMGLGIEGYFLFAYLSFIPAILELITVFKILEGTINFFNSRDEKDLCRDLIEDQRKYLIWQLLVISGGIILVNIPNHTFIFLAGILSLGARIYLLALVSRLKNTILLD
ncbi:MAG TPA: hypothetical protein VK031_01550 [Tissierellaceae bacterium]|nr:hypothetical protein [Tissierellaceae bacterium]